jgi:hypothetical protein
MNVVHAGTILDDRGLRRGCRGPYYGPAPGSPKELRRSGESAIDPGVGRVQLRKRLLAILSAISLFAVIGATTATAASVTPELIPGNPSCADATKIDPVVAGTYALEGGGYIVITLGANKTFNFDTEGSALVSSILVKGGPNAYLYSYDPPVTSDTGLFAPNGSGGQRAGLSHLCINSEKKDAPDPKK